MKYQAIVNFYDENHFQVLVNYIIIIILDRKRKYLYSYVHKMIPLIKLTLVKVSRYVLKLLFTRVERVCSVDDGYLMTSGVSHVSP